MEERNRSGRRDEEAQNDHIETEQHDPPTLPPEPGATADVPPPNLEAKDKETSATRLPWWKRIFR